MKRSEQKWTRSCLKATTRQHLVSLGLYTVLHDTQSIRRNAEKRSTRPLKKMENIWHGNNPCSSALVLMIFTVHACRDTVKGFTYLKYCIKESLRLFPPVPIVVRTLLEDTNFEGYTIPKGAWLASNIYAVHHSPEVWEDPEV